MIRLLLFVFIGSLCLTAYSSQHKPDMPEGHHHETPTLFEAPIDQETQAKLVADKKESEFNHHLAGLFVALGGAFMLLHGLAEAERPRANYIWPATFLVSGIFVLVWSDTELWPFGPRQWLESLEHNREVLQHKIFAALLLGLGSVEWLRVKTILRAPWSAFVFPLLAIGGSILLLFHPHEAGMLGPNHMELATRIQFQHLTYAVLGIGIGVSKGLAEVTTTGRRTFARLWPLLMLTLGILLMLYRE